MASNDLLGMAQSRAIPKPTLSLAGADMEFVIGPDSICRMRIGHRAFPVVVELPMTIGDVGNMRLSLAEIARQMGSSDNGEGVEHGA